jgi:CheY-specific phosphatase CheX
MSSSAKCTNTQTRRYILAAVLGVLGGGLVVAIATRAMPKIMSQMMSGMMRNMMAPMGEGGCNPAEM